MLRLVTDLSTEGAVCLILTELAPVHDVCTCALHVVRNLNIRFKNGIGNEMK